MPEARSARPQGPLLPPQDVLWGPDRKEPYCPCRPLVSQQLHALPLGKPETCKREEAVPQSEPPDHNGTPTDTGQQPVAGGPGRGSGAKDSLSAQGRLPRGGLMGDSLPQPSALCSESGPM